MKQNSNKTPNDTGNFAHPHFTPILNNSLTPTQNIKLAFQLTLIFFFPFASYTESSQRSFHFPNASWISLLALIITMKRWSNKSGKKFKKNVKNEIRATINENPYFNNSEECLFPTGSAPQNAVNMDMSINKSLGQFGSMFSSTRICFFFSSINVHFFFSQCSQKSAIYRLKKGGKWFPWK